MTNRTSSPPTPSTAFWQRFRDLGSLRRSSDHRVAAGVAEGLSRHFDIDPIIVRVLFVTLTFFGGAGIVLYLALWLTVPRDDAAHSVISGRANRDPQALTTAGLAIGGVLAAAAVLGSISWAVPHPFPFLLLVLFAALFLVALTRRRDGHQPAAGGPGPYATPPTGGASHGAAFAPTIVDAAPATPRPDIMPTDTAPTDTMPTDTMPTDTMPTDTMPTDTLPTDTAPTDIGPTDVATDGTDTITIAPPASGRAWWERDDIPPTGWQTAPLATVPPPPRRPRSHLFGLTMATTALVLAGLWIFDATTSVHLDPSVYPGVALGIIAIGLLLGTWWGRSRGLIAMGLLASVLTAGAAVVGPGPFGDQIARPTQASQLAPTYRLGVGRLALHLEQIADVAALNGRHVSIDARFGQVVVIIPSSVAARVDATVDHGRIDGGPGTEDIDNGGQHVQLTPLANGRPLLSITIHLRFGQIQLERAGCPGAGTPAFGESTQPWNGDSNVAAACA